MRKSQRFGGRPASSFKHQPTRVDRLADAKGMILARLSRGLPCEQSILSGYGMKPAEAERLIAELRRGAERLI